MKEELEMLLKKQQYRLVGNHGAVKLCHWMSQSLLKDRNCYKQDFYGIESHRCLQMTPVVDKCTQKCLFCWRVQGFESDKCEWNDPERVMDSLLEEQRSLVSGYRGDPRCSEEMWGESLEPRHVAISLAGEPTLYPHLGDLIGECHDRGMTTFLVTNGTNPRALEELDPLPTQLYVTVAAPNKEVYRRVCAPLIDDGWEKLMETLELLPSLDTRTVVRHTLVQGLNLGWEDQYSKIDEKADPQFIEPKGYVFVGSSRNRLSLSNMPSHQTVSEFSKRIAARLGLDILNEKSDSRVTLIGERGADTRLPSLG